MNATSGRESVEQPGKAQADWKKTVAFSGVILLAAAGITVAVFSTEPTAVRGGATKETAMLVDVTRAERGTFRPVLVATGTVRPEQDIQLSSRVDGEIIELAPDFSPGGFVEEGELLLRIDPADYRNVLQQRRSDLRRAMADLEIEMGRQDVAQRDYEILDKTLSPEKKELVLRKPQLSAAKVAVEAARAAVDQAELDLRRTTIRAPFSAHILSRDVNVGSQVAAGDSLGRLVGMETYWVVVAVPLSHLRWLSFESDEGEGGAEVKVRNRSAWPKGASRSGRLDRLVGALEEQTRMARVLVTVEDPLAQGEDAPEGAPALMIGEFVEARISGKEIADVIRLEREHVRGEDTVWVMQDGKLEIRQVEVVLRDAEYAYISSGLSEGDEVVTTNLSTVTDGARLRVGEAAGGDAE